MKNKVKIVELIADSAVGGGPAHVLGILRHLDKGRFDIFLICPKGYLTTEAKKIPGVTVLNLPFKSKFDLGSMFKLRRDLEVIQASGNPFGPMVLHSHGPRTGFFGLLSTPKNVTRIYTEHLFDLNYRVKNPINHWFQIKILKKICAKSDQIIAVSRSVREFLTANKLASEAKVTVIPNAIEVGARNEGRGTLRQVRENNKTPIVGTVGNLNVQKGQKYLIEAFVKILQKFPLARLEIIGEGPLRASLKSQVASLGKGAEPRRESLKLNRNVRFLGRQSDTVKFMRSWDVFALPSLSETFGIVILEAMQAGMPVVATKIGGIPDIIDNRKNGLLVEARNSDALAKAIISIIDHPVMAANFKREGLKTLERFDWKNVIKEIENVYVGRS